MTSGKRLSWTIGASLCALLLPAPSPSSGYPIWADFGLAGTRSAGILTRFLLTVTGATEAAASPCPQATGDKHKETSRARQTEPGGSNRGPGDTLPPNPPGAGTPPAGTDATPDGLHGGDPRAGGLPRAPGRIPLEQLAGRREISSAERWQVWWDRTRFVYLPFAPRKDGPPAANAATDDGRDHAALDRFRLGVAPDIRALAGHRSALVRAEALRALALMHDPAALDLLRAALADPVASVADIAVLSLGLSARPEAVHSLLHLARGTRDGAAFLTGTALAPYRQGLASLALTIDATPAASRLLGSMALDRRLTDEVRTFAAWGLGLCPDPNAMVPLVELYRRPDESPRLRATAALGLGHGNQRAVLPVALAQVRDGRPPIARSSALLLGLIATPQDLDAVDLLGRVVLRASDADLRAYATLALGLVGGPRTKAILERVLVRGRSQLTPWAAIATGLHLRASQDTALLRLLRRRIIGTMNVDDRCALSLGLGLSGMPEAAEELRRILAETASPRLAGFCALALGLLGQPADLATILRRAEHDHSPLYRARAGLGIASLGADESLGILLSWFRAETQPAVGRELAYGLGLLGRLDAVPLLAALLHEQTVDQARLASTLRALGLLLRDQQQPRDLRLAAHTNDVDEPASTPYVLSLTR